MKYKSHLLQTPLESSVFDLHNLVIESSILKNNALKDPPRKHNYVLVPKNNKPAPLVVHLSGYFGTGHQNFNFKALEENFPQQIAKATENKKIPVAVHVFVDAMTSLGGSQFINSDVCGNYESYIQVELMEAVENEYALLKGAEHRCLLGTSSGGYGALHHLSIEESPFGLALVSAPDSDFETSLLPDMYKTAPILSELTSLKKIKSVLNDGSLKKKKNFFDIMNTLAMTCCYSSMRKDTIDYPINLTTGEKNEKVWRQWLGKDPVHFLEKRAKNLKKKFIYLEVGAFDEFSLYFGSRKIKAVLEKNKIPHSYSEFPGGHFDSSERKLLALEWLKKKWQ